MHVINIDFLVLKLYEYQFNLAALAALRILQPLHSDEYTPSPLA